MAVREPLVTQTSEPWTVERGINDFDIVQGNARIAGYIQDERHADAMAAALDMLQALREIAGGQYVLLESGESACLICLEPEGQPHDVDCSMHLVLAAIAKAEGRS